MDDSSDGSEEENDYTSGEEQLMALEAARQQQLAQVQVCVRLIRRSDRSLEESRRLVDAARDFGERVAEAIEAQRRVRC